QYRIDGAADVMGDPDLGDANLTRLDVAVDFDNRSAKGVRRARTNARPLVGPCQFWRRIAAGARYDSTLRFGQLDRLRKGDALLRSSSSEHAAISSDQFIRLAMQSSRRHRQQAFANTLCSSFRRIAGHESDP